MSGPRRNAASNMTLAVIAQRRPKVACCVCGAAFAPCMMWQFTRHVCDECAVAIIRDCHGSYLEVAAGDRGIRPDYRKTPIPAELRSQVFIRDGHRCVKCGSQHVLQADHVEPESKGGAATLENLQTLCRSCNTSKGARSR